MLTFLALSQTKSEISLREYIDMRFDNIEKNTKVALESMNERLNVMNEFRGTINDQSKAFALRSETERRLEKHDADIRELRESDARNEGKTAMFLSIAGMFVSFVGLGIALYRKAEISKIKAETRG